jgi:hypothetical protein
MVLFKRSSARAETIGVLNGYERSINRAMHPPLWKNAPSPIFVPRMEKHPRPPDDDPRVQHLKRMGYLDGDFYFTPEGYVVWTEQYHLRRGYCCQSGCRHCPYGNSPEDRKRRK